MQNVYDVSSDHCMVSKRELGKIAWEKPKSFINKKYCNKSK